MQIIVHRKHNPDELCLIPERYGIEIDVRSNLAGELYLEHDPFKVGPTLVSWLNQYNHGTIILNMKEEGLEQRTIQILNRYNVANFFFLDLSFPFLIKTITQCGNVAVRVSEYESLQTALNLAGKAKWVWLDHFSKFPVTEQEFNKLKRAGYKICFVSPELQKFDENAVRDIIRFLKSSNIALDAVCTKLPQIWESSSL